MTKTVETVFITAAFSILALLLVAWIGAAVLGQAANRATCAADFTVGDLANSATICDSDTHDVVNSVDNKIQDQRGTRF